MSKVDLKSSGIRNPSHALYGGNEQLREVLDFLVTGELSQGDTQLFRPLYDHLLWQDTFMILADFQSYLECQEQIRKLWLQPEVWIKKSILNVAHMGKFSSDRSIQEYWKHIWKVEPIEVK